MNQSETHMEAYPKFIIEGSSLIMAKCTYHKQLVTDKEQVKGGGWFKFDTQIKAFVFNGSSHDFGKATLEDIKSCVMNGEVYGNSRKSRSMADFEFYYDTGTELVYIPKKCDRSETKASMNAMEVKNDSKTHDISLSQVAMEIKNEWDGYTDEIYDALRNQGWHVHVVDGEVLCAIDPGMSIGYSYDKNSPIPIRTWNNNNAEENASLNKLLRHSVEIKQGKPWATVVRFKKEQNKENE